jgi:transcriptional regulator GlxA family with amidase domain
MPKAPHIPATSQTLSVARAIEMVAFRDVQLLDVAGPLQVFATANETIAKAGGAPPYTVRVVARQERSVTASVGVVVATVDLPPLDTPVDTLIIAGGPGVKVAAAEGELVSWVRARAGTARRTASVCTGAYLLAATGLSTDVARPRTGRSVMTWREASPPYTSNPIRFSCVTARFGLPRA